MAKQPCTCTCVQYTYYVIYVYLYSYIRNCIFQRENKKGDKNEDNSDESTNVLDEKVCI